MNLKELNAKVDVIVNPYEKRFSQNWNPAGDWSTIFKCIEDKGIRVK